MRKRAIYLLAGVAASLGLIVAVLFMFSRSASAAPRTLITVDTTLDEVTVDGACSLREAILAANSDTPVDTCPAGGNLDLISLPAGVYTMQIAGADEDGSMTGDYDITASVIISGAGISHTVIVGAGLDRIFHVNPLQTSGVSVELRHLSLQAGRSLVGGGILNQGRLTLADVHLADSVAGSPEDGGEGGGIWSGGPLTISMSTVVGNRIDVGGDAGGIYSEGPLSIFASVIRDNMAYEGAGGGVRHESGPLTISGTEIVGNLAGGVGGIYIDTDFDSLITNSLIATNRGEHNTGGLGRRGEGTLSIVNTVISGNVSTYGTPGGVANQIRGGLALSGTSIVGNEGQSCGGIDSYGSVIIESSSILSNTASFGDGGGLCASGGSGESILNTTISGNTAAGHGGGVYVRGFGPVTLNNVTIAGNTADGDADEQGDGGGIWVAGIGSLIEIQNSILAGNHDQSTSERYPDCMGDPDGIITHGYNLIGVVDGCPWPAGPGDQLGSLSNPLDPLLAPLADNGTGPRSHLPLSGSPAIEGGNPVQPGSGTYACAPQDQRGVERPQGEACDIGAIELGSLSVHKTDRGDPVLVNDRLIYEITVRHTDPLTATGVVLTDTLPHGVLLSAVPGGCLQTSQRVVCSLGNFEFNATVTLTISVTPTITGYITNTVEVAAIEPDPLPTDNVAAERTFVALGANYLPVILKQP